MSQNTQFFLGITQASLNQTALDWPQNTANHYESTRLGIKQGSDLILNPELSLTGYEVNDDFQRADNKVIYNHLLNQAAYAQNLSEKEGVPCPIISIGHPWRLQLRGAFEKADPNPDLIKNPLYDRLSLPFNVQSLLYDGRVIAMTAKANLFNDERGYEKRYFNEWSFSAAQEYARLTGTECKYGTISIALPDGKQIPFGRPIVYVKDKDGHAFVLTQFICEEKWAASAFDGYPYNFSRYEQFNLIPDLHRYLGTRQGVVGAIANASPPARGKHEKHIVLNNEASKRFGLIIDTDGLGTSGASYAQFGSRYISQDGKTISIGERMNFGQAALTHSVVNIDSAPAELESKAHLTIDRELSSPGAQRDVHIAWDSDKGAWDDPQNPDQWKEERIRNQALWMFDYMRKSKSKGIAEAISGGQDSSFNCAMVRVMVELAMHDLGVDGFCEQMNHLPYIGKIRNAHEAGGHKAAVAACMDNMLTAVYMGTNNSSYETWYAAKTLMDGDVFENGKPFPGVGGKFLERNVQDLVTSTAFTFGAKNVSAISSERKAEIFEALAAFVHASPHEYSPEDMKHWANRLQRDYPEVESLTSAALPGQGIAYENFQARIREVLIMALANVEAKMAVANPNLDEAYGAYATFGGDLHSGTVNWNGGVHKKDQQELMRYLEEKGVQGIMDRIVALSPANNNQPTAELQPKQDGEVAQNDEDALQGTFPQKAALARLRHHTKMMTKHGERWFNASEVYQRARQDNLFDGLDDNRLFNAVTNFYSRWEGPAQHKVHATPISNSFGQSVDKQTSLRTPNLSGGSRDEIVQMGIGLLYDWAKDESLNWAEDDKRLAMQRATQDKAFVQEFYSKIWNRDPALEHMSYNLRGLYDQLTEKFLPLKI